LRRLLEEHEPDPIDENAEAALLDPEYAQGLERYDQAFQALSEPVWREHYMQEGAAEAQPEPEAAPVEDVR